MCHLEHWEARLLWSPRAALSVMVFVEMTRSVWEK
jgi:hypothetical protein